MNIKKVKEWLFRERDKIDRNLDVIAMDKLRHLAKEYKIEFDSDASKPVIAAAVKAAIEKETAPRVTKKQQSAAARGEVYRYRCKTRCTFKGKLVREGDTIFLDKEQDLTHFELVKDVKDQR